jgi:hypothetical protein
LSAPPNRLRLNQRCSPAPKLIRHTYLRPDVRSRRRVGMDAHPSLERHADQNTSDSTSDGRECCDLTRCSSSITVDARLCFVRFASRQWRRRGHCVQTKMCTTAFRRALLARSRRLARHLTRDSSRLSPFSPPLSPGYTACGEVHRTDAPTPEGLPWKRRA